LKSEKLLSFDILGLTCEKLQSETPGPKFVEANIDSNDAGITDTTLYIIVGKVLDLSNDRLL
jgi:hypothetical protein